MDPVAARPSGRRALAVAALIAAAVVAAWALGLGEYARPAKFRAWIESWGAFGPVVYIVGYVVAEMLFAPALPLTLLGGIAFGPLWGTVYVSIAATLGAAGAFLLARYALRDLVRHWMARSPALARLDAAVAAHGWRMLVVTRLVPLFPFNLQNFAYGLTSIKFTTFVGLSWLCMLPATAAYTVAAGAIADGTASPRRTVALLAGAGVLLVGLSLLPRWIQRRGLAKLGVAAAVAIGATLAAPAPGAAQPAPVVLDFTPPAGIDAPPPGWEPLTFRRIERHTRYRVEREGDGFVLRADSAAAASALYRLLDLDPRVYRRLSWRWKVAGILAKGDARRKEGDDYPARIYVAFRYDPATATMWERIRYGAIKLFYGQYPPRGVLNYVWDNRLSVGTTLDNPYTDRAKMVVVESGPERVGRWLTAERDIYDDFRRLFGGEPPRLAGIAIMTDTDDTGESATAWYGRITLSPGTATSSLSPPATRPQGGLVGGQGEGAAARR